MTQRTWKWLMVLALVATAVIGASGQIDIPVVSDLVKRVKCQEDPDCREFVRDEIERALRAERQRNFVRPEIRRGGGEFSSSQAESRAPSDAGDGDAAAETPGTASPSVGGAGGGDAVGTPGGGGGQPGGGGPSPGADPSGPGPEPETPGPSVGIDPGADCPVNADVGPVEAEVCLE